MSPDLGSALRGLTSDQPLQPPDRLSSVTHRARRIRRTRASVAVAAVVAVTAPIGLLLSASGGGRPAPVAGQPVTGWPDRSPAADRGVAEGAVGQWASHGPHPVADLRWLYRGAVEVPGGARLYVASWVADGQVVLAWVQRSDVDDLGSSLASPDGDIWKVLQQPATPSTQIVGAYLPRVGAETIDDNYLFVLAAPGRRTLHWQADALPYAPTSTDVRTTGELTSDNGVLTGWSGPIEGPIRVRLGASTALLALPTSEPRLLRAPAPDVPSGATSVGISAGSGQLGIDNNRSIGFSDASAEGTARVYLRCYGGGKIDVVLEDASGRTNRVLGHMPCDLQTHAVDLPAAHGSRLMSLMSDRLQVFTFRTVHVSS